MILRQAGVVTPKFASDFKVEKTCVQSKSFLRRYDLATLIPYLIDPSFFELWTTSLQKTMALLVVRRLDHKLLPPSLWFHNSHRRCLLLRLNYST